MLNLKLKVIDIRTRLIDSTPYHYPKCYSVVRLNRLHSRSIDFDPLGIDKVLSRVTIPIENFSDFECEKEALMKCYLESGEVDWPIEGPIEKNVLCLEVYESKAECDDEKPLEIFEPEKLGQMNINLSTFEKNKLCDIWQHWASDQFCFEVRISYFLNDDSTEKSSAHNLIASEYENFDNEEMFDELGQKINASENFRRNLCFRKLNEQRNQTNQEKWNSFLTNQNSLNSSEAEKEISRTEFIQKLAWNFGIPRLQRNYFYSEILKGFSKGQSRIKGGARGYKNCSFFPSDCDKMYYWALVKHFMGLTGQNLKCPKEKESDDSSSFFDRLNSPGSCSEVTSLSDYFDSQPYFDEIDAEYSTPKTAANYDPNWNLEPIEENETDGSKHRNHLTPNMAMKISLEIDKDVNRVFKQGRTYVNTLQGKMALKRVLGAYAMRNITVGYCQGMNFIAGLLLEVVSEEVAFYMLALICEGPLFRYHCKDMVRVRADIAAMREIFNDEFPDLSEMALMAGLPLELIVAPSLLVCFINFLPAPTALRCLEVIVVDGEIALFAIALSFIRLHEKIFALAIESDELLNAVTAAQAGMYDSQLLLDQAAIEMEGKAGRIRSIRRKCYERLANKIEKDWDVCEKPESDVFLLGWTEQNNFGTILPFKLLGGGIKGLANATVRTLQWLLGAKLLTNEQKEQIEKSYD